MTPSNFASLQARVETVEQAVANNTAITESIKADTGEIVEAWKSAKGGFKVLEILGKVAKPIAAIAGSAIAISTFWTWVKTIARTNVL